MIVTHRSKVPWIWVVLITIPWMAGSLSGSVNGTAITYTIKKFIADPSLIALLTSINLISNVLIGAPCNYMSDRVWTRWGRRRPFLVSGMLSSALLMLFIPFVPNIWVLVVVNLLFQITIDIATPLEALYFEVIPQPQRGRSVAIRTVMMSLAGVFFSMVLFAHFDDRYAVDLGFLGLGRRTLTGEVVLYWVVAAFTAGTALLLLFYVREAPVESPLRGEKLRPLKFVKDVFADRRWWLVYLYYVVPTVLFAGTGQFSPLVMTENFGYSKAQMAQIGVPQMIIQLVVFTPLLGWIADRVPRARMFQVGVYGSMLHAAFYWIFINFVAAGRVPSLTFILCYGLLGTLFTTCLWVTYGALLFDLMPSNLMGTLASGFGLINSVLGALFMNLCGWFIKYFSLLFFTPHKTDPTKYDYVSIYLFQAIFGILAIAMFQYFFKRYREGKVVEYGKLELQQEQEKEALGSTATGRA